MMLEGKWAGVNGTVPFRVMGQVMGGAGPRTHAEHVEAPLPATGVFPTG
jgi:hypothetical protein